ncbi:efflux RND transporter periplasmic adaptor subunit [Mucilaginibacter sp. X5P1]|uniref:efflux RND transporter periplasmic adaptor subunit n=1 Tax=Mucilaginibacter sp. X5P1 TaxID=2723088 RepID=UPI001610503C|nr:efflux RND transporter periplasmic adaptor subunit [Mucilaginibacter sp. X5P1]MBB6140489.1 RND family efflux transporter MFP subunit [Mucilaginibacter sp. X5P1]
MNIKQNRLFIALTIMVIGTGFLSACGPNKKDKEEQNQTVEQVNALDTPTVSLITVAKGKLTSNITVPGELQPYQQVNLYAKINSYVKSLTVDIGSQVHQGQLLATLEAPEINSQLEEAKSRIQQNKAIYFASKATYDRLYSTSKTPGTVSENDLEQAIAKMQSDSANVEAAKSAYKVVSANLAYLQIRAPFDGIITLRNINLGTYVGPAAGGGNQPLFVIEDHKRLRLVISIPESFTGGLTNKDQVSFTIKELQGEKFTAKIERLAGSLDNTLRSERLEMDVYNTNGKLLPNMYADVNVPLPSRDSAFIVPKSAVVTSTEKVFVIRVKDGKAEWVNAKKGLEAGDMVELYADIQPGDQLVKAATEEIRDGASVKIGSSPVAADDDKGAKKDTAAKK